MKEIFSIIVLLSLLCVPVSTEYTELTPENTVILSNETDESFCKDFSVLLKRLKPEWVILNSAEIPHSIRDKNLIIVGSLNSQYTNDIIKELITQKEVTAIEDGQYTVYEKDNPWSENKIIICTGPDKIFTKKAAEVFITSLEGEWVNPPFTSVPSDEAHTFLTNIQYIPQEELPKEELGIQVDAQSPSYITYEEALKDVEYLFYLFSHGYCGYGYFKTKGSFDDAKQSILQVLKTESEWTPDDFSQVLHDNLTFIHDMHLSIGSHKYGSHKDFWYDTTLEFQQTMGNYSFVSDNTEYQVISVNGEPPHQFMFPSLNKKGNPIYRLGTLSDTPPEPLTVTVQTHDKQETMIIPLKKSDFENFTKDIFQEQPIGGIPVVRIRSFSDHHITYIDKFLEAAKKYKGEPIVIIDIRGNGGGNEKWPKEWVTQFTGRQPSSKRYFTELTTKTTMMGRANYFEWLGSLYPDVNFYQTEKDRFMTQVNLFEKQHTTPYWSGPFHQDASVIPNETTVICVTNKKVASAAEGFISYLQQVENVIFVGENTRGALVFGQMTLHQLPYSKLSLNLPISLNIPLDLVLREEKGFFPDLWVPAEDAVNYAVAAVRNNTITTVKSIPEEVLQSKFTPESQWISQLKGILVPVLLLTATGMVPAVVNRKKGKKFFFMFGIFFGVAGGVVLYLVSFIGYVYMVLGLVYIGISVYKWRNP
ncbi:MAG: S41 family peptidase [Candidatus Methanofastidiosia archaeon]|jgi:C-terminal processing protease CtpA/Prc